ncbi:response regulator [Actinoplanes xinjiangensis]|uniref:response regulator n=1 Tax=Actinoplanes xinjiangensis TaxID=512350 RepID=UPI003418031E
MTTLLIVEDTEDLRRVLDRLFTRAGFTVHSAADGQAALDLARRHPPDVVLTDLDMPRLDGLQLCKAIRADPALCDTPVAILSGGITPGDPRTADSTACGVWLKPFDSDDLVAAVRHLADLGHHTHPGTPAPCTRHHG